MDVASIAGSLLLMRSAQTQENLSIGMMKQASDQQNQMAGLLAQSAAHPPQPSPGIDSGITFSTYA